MTSFAELVREIERRRDAADRPIVVGVSGYGGAGKTTLAAEVAAMLPGALVVRGDDYLDPALSRVVSDDWTALDRTRLIADVLEPARAGDPVVVRVAIWPHGGITRGRADGLDHDALWAEVWRPTEEAFDRRFRPRDAADLVVFGP